MGGIWREILIALAIVFTISSFFLPAFCAGIGGLFLALLSSMKLGLKGGLLFSAYAFLVLVMVFFVTDKYFTFNGLVTAFFAYFLMAMFLGQATDTVNKERKRLQLIFEGTNMGTWEWNIQTDHTMINEKWAQILGYRREELEPISPETIDRLIHSHDEGLRKEILRRYVEGELEDYSSEYRMKHKEGHWVWVLDRGKILQWSEDGKPLWMFGICLDITEQKLAADELKQKSLVLNQIQDHVTITDLHGTITYVNQSNAEMFGVPKEEMIGKTTEIYGEDSVRGVSQREIIEQTLNNGHWRGEVINYDRDGNEQIMDCRAQVICDEKERPIALAGISTNITQRKKEEKEMQEREERLRAIFEAAKNIAIIVTDAHPIHPRILEFSPGAEVMFGYKKGEIIGEKIEILHQREDVEQFPEMFKKMESNQIGFSGEATLLRQSNEEFTAIFTTHPLFNSDGVMWGTLGISVDISEQKELENALKESEEKYRSIVDQTMEMIYLHTLDGSFLEVNRAAVEQTGYTKEELLKMNVFDLHLDSSDQDSLLSLWQGWSIGEKVTLEAQHKRKDGSIFPVEVTTGKALIGGKECILALVRDMTDRKKAEEEIEQAKNMLEVVIDSIPQYIFWKDRNSVYLGCNRIGARVAGLQNPEDIVGKTDYDLAWEREEADFYRMCDERVMSTGKAEFHIIEPQLQADGKQAWLDTNKVPLFDSQGEVVGVLVTFEDITERKRTEQDLVEARQFLHSIIESIPDPIFVKDEQHNWIILNRALCQFMGYSKEMFLGQSDYDLFPKEEADVFWEKDNLVFETGKENINEEYITDSSGREHFISTKKSLFTVGSETYLVGVIRDITERKETEKKLGAYTQKIEDLYFQLEEEMAKARKIHTQILPTTLPKVKGIRFAAHYQPAKRIGGDFYGVLRVHNKLIIYLSDVSGHGLDSAMLSFFVKHTIKGFLSFCPSDGISPATILKHLAKQYKQENYPQEYFICIFIGVLDLETMEWKYSGAGFQDTPFVQLGGREQLTLKSKGLFITSFFPLDLMKFKEKSITLTPKTTIFMNTDGLTEEGSPGDYYRDRLPQLFYDHSHLPPHLISQVVVEDFREFNGGSLQGKDDITFLIMQVEPSGIRERQMELATDFDELKRMREEVLNWLGDTDSSHLLVTCLTEMVVNAMEHGNQLEPEKIVRVHLKEVEGHIEACVEDGGEGFDWRERLDQPLDLEGDSDRGRGIAMTKLFCDGIFYNEKGNQVTFYIRK